MAHFFWKVVIQVAVLEVRILIATIMIFGIVLEPYKHPYIFFDLAKNEDTFFHDYRLPATSIFSWRLYEGVAKAENSFSHAYSVTLLLDGHFLRPVD